MNNRHELENLPDRTGREREWCLRQASKSKFGVAWPWTLSLISWLPKSTVSFPFIALWTTYQYARQFSAKVGFVFKISRSQDWQRTDGRTDDIPVGNMISPASLGMALAETSKQASNFIRQNNEKIQIYCWIMNIIHLAGCQWSFRLS